MPDTQLQTAKFYEALQQSNPETAMPDSGVNQAVLNEPAAVPRSNTSGWERASSWVSVAVLGAVVLVLAPVAYSSIKGIPLPHSLAPTDWMMWLGGAKSDQTFDKFLKDSLSKNQSSFADAFKQSQAMQVDFSKMQMQLTPQALGYAPQSSFGNQQSFGSQQSGTRRTR